MSRKKVKLQWIVNDSARKSTLKKRKKGLLKKVSELSTLCGVQACAVVYSPNDSTSEVWPSLQEAHDTVQKFKSMPLIEQRKKMMTQETFLKQRLDKARDQLKKTKRDNRVFEMTELLYATLVGQSLDNVVREDLGDMIWVLEDKLRDVTEKMNELKQREEPGEFVDQKIPVQIPMQEPIQIPIQMQTPMPVDNKCVEIMEALQRQQWLMELLNSAPPPLPRGVGYYGATEDFRMPYGNNSGGNGGSYSGGAGFQG